MNQSGQKIIDTSYMRSYASRPTGMAQQTVSPNKIMQPAPHSPMLQSRVVTSQMHAYQSNTSQRNISPLNLVASQRSITPINKMPLSPMNKMPLSPINRSVSPI